MVVVGDVKGWVELEGGILSGRARLSLSFAPPRVFGPGAPWRAREGAACLCADAHRCWLGFRFRVRVRVTVTVTVS